MPRFATDNLLGPTSRFIADPRTAGFGALPTPGDQRTLVGSEGSLGLRISLDPRTVAEHGLAGEGDDIFAGVGADEFFEELAVNFRAVSAGLGIASEAAGAERPGTLEYLPFLNTYLARFGGHCWPHPSTENPYERVSVVIEPSDGASVVYEPAARKSTTNQPVNLLCLELSIANQESTAVHLNKVTLSFSAPPSVPEAVIPVPTNWWPPGGSGVHIPPGETAVWNFLREGFENDTVVLPSPAPGSLTLSLFFDGFSSPWTVTRTLAPHKNLVSDDSYLYPARFDDLRPGEFWNTSSDTHGTGAQGSQLFAYDMNVVAYDTSKGQLNRLLPVTDGSKNEHYRVWGKKIRAMADGTVAQFLDGVGANYFPGTGNAAGPWQEPPWDNPAKAWADKVGAGNHFYIRHGSEVVLYAHMQKGTLNPNLLKLNAPVKAGDYLGLAGNAGSASEPHLHIHAINGTEAESGPLRPLLFHDIFTVDPSLLSLPNTAGPWARV